MSEHIKPSQKNPHEIPAQTEVFTYDSTIEDEKAAVAWNTIFLGHEVPDNAPMPDIDTFYTVSLLRFAKDNNLIISERTTDIKAEIKPEIYDF